MHVPFASPHAQFLAHRHDILKSITRVCDSGIYTLGPEVQAFEEEFAAYHDMPHCIGVGSGTDALILALQALDIGPGDEVITVSHTALATLSAILSVGATPVCIDVEPDFYTLDPTRLEGALSSKTRAVLPVHLYGQPCDMHPIMAFAQKHHLSVIEDCAQAHGASYHGKKVGTFGDIGCFSFYPTKNLGALGDGGALITKDAATAACLKRLRQYGWDKARVAQEVSRVSRLDEIQAAILRVKLTSLNQFQEKRCQIAAFYDQSLSPTKFTLPALRQGTQHAYHLYVIQAKDRETWRQTWKNRGVETGVHYALPGHLHKGYKDRVRLPEKGLPVTEQLSRNVVSLPMYPELKDAELKTVLETLNKD